MRKVILICLLNLLVSTVGSLALADGIILPEALSPDYLAVRYHNVTVDIKDNHVVTRVVQEFYNPHSVSVTGRYLFPIPPEAILSNFQATVDGYPQQVTRQDAVATNAVLYDTITQRRDPSLLQYADWETLAFTINLPAGSSRQMVLTYEEVLAPSGGMYHYRYILSTERYSSQPLEKASITVNLDVSAGLGSLYSSSHAVTTERLGQGRAQIMWEAENVRPNEDFDLFFAPADGDFGSGLLTGQREGYGQNQDHFLFLFAPETETMQRGALPKDIVFVVDRSGSMSGEKIEQAKNALQFILSQLNPNDRFSIVAFDDRLEVFSYTLQTVNNDTLMDARHFVNQLYADKSTDLEIALQTGLRIFERSESRAEASRLLIFLTDGLPTAGITDGTLIASLVAQTNEWVDARLHTFGVGYDVNTHLLDRLAESNNGSVTYVQPGENLELVLTDFYRRIASPLLTNVEVEFEGMTVSDLYPQQLPDMFQGSSLLLSGRYQATTSTVTVHVRGWTGEQQQEYSYQFDMQQTGNYAFVPRLWATRRIGQLLDQVRVSGETAALVEEIRALGLGYGIVTPYTTFVITAQTEGAASASNMDLYSNQAELNQFSGETTVQARVQNQTYQQADQANLASGGNVINNAQHSMAQISDQNIDLSLFKLYKIPNEPITDEWISKNINVDREVIFGSDAYFVLADDSAIRPFLQSGTNVIFVYEGEVIAVQEQR